jgi:hypothetical protein
LNSDAKGIKVKMFHILTVLLKETGLAGSGANVGRMRLLDITFHMSHLDMPSRHRLNPTDARLICAAGPFVGPIQRIRLAP